MIIFKIYNKFKFWRGSYIWNEIPGAYKHLWVDGTPASVGFSRHDNVYEERRLYIVQDRRRSQSN